MVILKCKNCGNDFKVENARKNIAKYCSQKCYLDIKSKGTKIKKCEYCGVEFKKQKHQKDKKYCSHKCYALDKKKKRKESICNNCGKIIIDIDETKRSFCSRECYFEFIKKEKESKRKKICKNCNKEYQLKYNTPNQEFCSRECYWEFRNNNPGVKFQSNQGKNMIEKKCEICGKMFEVFKYRNDTAKYCSVDCFKKSGYNISKFSIDVFNELQCLYENIEQEKSLNFNNKKLFPDIIINDKIIIECQGDYWHCNPEIFENHFYNKKIDKYAYEIWERDDIRKSFLEKNGYVVYFLWEKNWNENKEKEIIKIEKVVSKWNEKK